MYHFKYNSEWTESYEDYEAHSFELCNKIIDYIENYETYAPLVKQQAFYLTKDFFDAGPLYDKFN
jgi:hypothetical protein